MSLKARDVHEKLHRRNIDPVLLDVIMRLAEEQHAIGRAIPEMAKSFDSLATVLTQHTRILENNKDALQRMQKRVGDVKSLGDDEG